MAASDTDVINQKKLQAEAIAKLEEIAGSTFNDDDILFEGQKFVLPAGSSIADGARFLARKAKEYEEGTSFVRKYTYRPWDVSYCMMRAFKRLFGSVSHSGTFMSPPQLIEIPSGPGEVVQVPLGEFQIPHLPEVVFTVGGTGDDDWGQVGYVQAYGPKKLSKAINAVFEVIGMELEQASLYRGKAIIHGEMPRFMEVDKINPDRIVYASEVQDAIDTHIMARLDFPDVLKELDISFRSKILLEGEFGVGKTEALNLAAKRAAAREVTFIMVPKDQQHDLIEAMRTARMYEPAVVAFEDVDTVGGADTEANRISSVLDAFDGGQSKTNKVMVLLTTNHVETLHKGMVRPGRIDAIIHIAPPDAEGIRRILEVNMKPGTVDPEMRWHEVAEAMEGYHPAFVVEAASRATRYAIVRQARENGGKASADITVTTADMKAAAYELKRQWDIHTGAKTGADENRLDDALRSALTPAVEKAVELVVAERINHQVGNGNYGVDPEKLPRQVQ
jgi:transitional endoplasmic reticulum ATPase